jgi:hypothetical protein
VGDAATAATAGGRSWRPRRCDEETLLLRRSEEGAGCPLSSSLVPATEREKKLLWFKGHRKMRAELGGGRSGEDGLCGDRLVMFLAEGEEKKVCVQRGGPVCLAESESNQREDGRSQNGGRFGLSLAKRGEVAGYGR